jgi:anti-anti-sigma regulatory factor
MRKKQEGIQKTACLGKDAAPQPETGWEVKWAAMLRKAKICSEKFQFPIEGMVTSGMVNELREAILPAIVRAHEIEIEIDLLHVSEIDFAGLLLMVETKLTALAHGKTLRFIRYSRPVVEILAKSDLTDFFSAPRFGRENLRRPPGQEPNASTEQE